MTKDDFNFAIFNVLLFDCYIPTAPAYGVYISQLIPYGRACSLYSDVLQRHRILRTKLLNPKWVFFSEDINTLLKSILSIVHRKW